MPTATLQEIALTGFTFDRTAANAHVMEPAHAANVISSRGPQEGNAHLAYHGAPSGPLGFNTEGFIAQLNTALATHTAGYAMELREHGQIIASNNSGGAHLPTDGNEPWTEGIRMHIASCSKLVTAMAMTRTLAAHNISPDTPIVNYLPTYWTKGPNIDKITFRELMTQHSGFNVVTSNSTYPWMKSQVAAGVKATDIGQYAYENMNFGLCRIMIPIMNGNIAANHSFPVATQDSDWDYFTINAYSTYVAQNIFKPANVSGPTLDHPSPDALAYQFPAASGWNSGDLSTYSGGAGWHMTVAELLDVMGDFRRAGNIMSTTAAQAMLDAGFGIDVISNTPLGTLYNKNGRWQNGNNGQNPYVEQSLAYFLPLDMDLVVFANSPVTNADTFFRDMVTNIYLANIGPAVSIGTWEAHHNMSGEQFQEMFNNLVTNEGMQLVDVSGYGPTGDLYAALWVKNASTPAWQARNGLTADQYQTTFNQLTAQGYSPAVVNGYDAGGQPHFACIFQQGQIGAFVAHHNMSAADFQTAFNQNVAAGYTLTWVSGYSNAGQANYAAIWRKLTNVPAWQARNGMTAAQYQDTFNQLNSQGYKPTVVSGYAIGNQPYYAAIFQKIANAPAWVTHNGMTADQYQATFDQLVGQGYRLTNVCGYTVAGQNQFAAIWSK